MNIIRNPKKARHKSERGKTKGRAVKVTRNKVNVFSNSYALKNSW
jgi:hypothetical protein